MTVACVDGVAEDRWLSDVLGRRVFRIEAGSAAATADEVRRHIDGQSRALYWAKVDTTRIDVVRMLGQLGFYVVDVNLVFARVASEVIARRHVRVTVAPVHPEQHTAVLAIAGGAFVYSRFHLDPLISRVDADRVKREWIASYLRGARGEELLTASVGAETVGFLAVLRSEFQGAPSRTIDLIAVAPAWQRRGVAQSLVDELAARSRKDVTALVVGTQAANRASVRLYEGLGFRLAASRYVMHLHRG